MYKYLLVGICYWISSFTLFAQDITPQQKAWLYKIVKKTPCLNRNWISYFDYTGGIHEEKIVNEVGDTILHTYQVTLWDSVEQNIIRDPELLKIDWPAIRNSSPGLISNAAVKLSLWELYNQIRNGYEESPHFSSKNYSQIIYSEIIQSLPPRMKKGNQVKKKYLPVVFAIINPSLNIDRKIKSFETVGNVTLQEKRKVFDRWHQLISSHIEKTSQLYFNQLLGNKTYFKGALLAVGDGSGSSGLLDEKEGTEEGKEINTGTGKGIGLFTYKMKVRKDNLVPEYLSEIKLNALQNEPSLVHLTLWGMDWSKPPVVVIENGKKSYVLFGTPEFSPNPDRVPGISYFDRMEDYRERKIKQVINELNKDGGLLSIYRKEEAIRNQIQFQIDSINFEVDSLRELGAISDAAIENRRFKNEVNLSNLTDKEKRLASLQRKISAEYNRIERAEKELDNMKAALGEEPQQWKKEDGLYLFEDGSIFNFKTQDLILSEDSLASSQLHVKLLAATYSAYSDAKDEVQLYVNVTGGVDHYLGTLNQFYKKATFSDTLISRAFFYKPNAYTQSNILSDKEVHTLNELAKNITDKKLKVVFNLFAMGVDILNTPLPSKINYTNKQNEANFKTARRSELSIIQKDDTLFIQVNAYADAGNTSLSNIHRKQNLQQLKTKYQSLNPALSALRVLGILAELEKYLPIDINDEIIEVVPNQYKIKVGEVKKAIPQN